MKRLIADMHTHTIASGHAYGTIRENAQAAAERGLEILGIAEHAPGIPGSIDPFYFCNIQLVPKNLFGVRMVMGCELNVLNDRSPSLDERWARRLDFAIIGIHTEGKCYTDAGQARNTDNIIHYMKDPIVKIAAHPDDDNTPLDYLSLVQAAKEYGVALEVNNSSLRKGPGKRLNCVENYRTMLGLCQEMRVPIVINSDAHDPSFVGELALGQTLVEEFDFDEELILNNDAKKLLAFLGLE